MKYNEKLKTEVLKKMYRLKDVPNLYYFVFEFKEFNHHKTLKFRIRQSLNNIRNFYGVTNKEFKYIGVIETSSKFTKEEYLFDENIDDVGLHIHLFVSSPEQIKSEMVRDTITHFIKRHITSKNEEISLWVGDDVIEIYERRDFFEYHTKQLSIDRGKDFIVTNM